MEWWLLAIVLFSALLVLLIIGLPIAFSMGLIAVVGIVIGVGSRSLAQVPVLAFTYGTNFILVCIPLYVFMAEIAFFSGFGSAGYKAAHHWLGWLPGGLAVSTVAACAGFASITGSSVANAATVGLVAIPEMKERGYDKRLATGCVAAGGTLGILIPPSAVMILYGIITEQSIGRLFIAGILPGIMVALAFMAYIVIWAKINPEKAPRGHQIGWGERFSSLKGALPVLMLAATVLGFIYTGVTTVTEAAGVGALGAIIIGLIYRRLNWTNLKAAILGSVRTTGFIFLILFAAMSFSFLLSALKIPQQFAETIVSLGVNRWIVQISIQVLFLFLGCFIDPAGILVLTLPTLFPLIMHLGFDPIWFGIMMTVNMEMANITPPVGLNLFVIKGISPPDVKLSHITQGALPFVGILGLSLVVLSFAPQIALWLPSLMK